MIAKEGIAARAGSHTPSGRHGASNGSRQHPQRGKRLQSSAALKFSARLDETRNMPLPLSAAPSRNERQLVFTSSQAARYLGVSLATVRRWTDAGHISCYRTPGGQRRFSRAQLDDFIGSMQRTGPAESTAASAHSDAQVA
jgi:excisionase family DNA binding protein